MVLRTFTILRVLLPLLLLPLGASEPLRVAAAADLRDVLPELVRGFERGQPGVRVEVVYGASGSLTAQIQAKAPFDVFLSADEGYPAALASMGLGLTPPFRYSRGQLVLWVGPGVRWQEGGGLGALQVRRLALANPRTAPYGRAAEAALRRAGCWDRLQPTLVFGENVSQTATFAATGAVEAAFISASQAPPLRARGKVWTVPVGDYPPLIQAGLILKTTSQAPAAKAFQAYLSTATAQACFLAHGFLGLP